jgi:hypothetical protein
MIRSLFVPDFTTGLIAAPKRQQRVFTMASDQDCVSALNAFLPQLSPGAIQKLAVLWTDLPDHDASTLRDVIRERLARPENAKYLAPVAPKHPAGSVAQIAEDAKSRAGLGGGSGLLGNPLGVLPLLDNTKIAPGSEAAYIAFAPQTEAVDAVLRRAQDAVGATGPGKGFKIPERPRPALGTTRMPVGKKSF